MNILFLGDVYGKMGRQSIARLLPEIVSEKKIDFVIANADNVAHGKGITPKTIAELQGYGVDVFTNGDHAFSEKNNIEECYNGEYSTIRPANFPPNSPGVGYRIIKKGKYEVLVINLLGRVFMKLDYDCPFRKVDEILANFAKQKLSAIIVDIHAEATSEKIALFRYLDGRVSAVLGTHTHVLTADEQISDRGTAYLSDAGMVGYNEGIIGLAGEGILKTFLEQIKYHHVVPDKGQAVLSGAVIKINVETGKAESIETIRKIINIK